MDSSGMDGLACPTCGTMNESGWAFCQQCGSRLPQSAPPAAMPPPVEQPTVVAPPPRDYPLPPVQPTVVDQQSYVPPSPPRAPEPPPARDYPQPPAQPAAYTPPAVEAQSYDPLDTIFEQPTAAPPAVEHPYMGKPTVVVPPTPEPNAPYGQVTVPDHQPVRPPTPVPMPAAGGVEPSAAPPASATTGSTCLRCGRVNPAGSAFCSACGTPLLNANTGAGQTLVMTSRPAEPPPPPPPPPIVGRLHLIMEGGQAGDEYEVKDETVIGRASGEITFPHDGFMSGRHARIERRGNKFFLRDEGSRNGTFIKIKDEVELQPGDMVLVGKQLFRFEV